MSINIRVINADCVIVSTKYRVKVVSFEVAAQLFELMKMRALKAISAKLYIKAMNDIIEQ
jgi:hypothetical protein